MWCETKKEKETCKIADRIVGLADKVSEGITANGYEARFPSARIRKLRDYCTSVLEKRGKKKAVKEEGITQEEAIVVKANKLACYLRNYNKNLTKKQEEYFEELWLVMTDWEYVKKNLAYYHLDGVREKK